MGKRGPKPLPAEELEKRGSKRASARRKDEATAKRKPRRSSKVAEPPPDPLPASDDRAGWYALLAALPGYDSRILAGAIDGGCRFDGDRARHAIEWIEEHCRHVKGELTGQRIRLAPAHRAFVAAIYGWRRTEDDTRRYRYALWYAPRKSSKTTLAACIGLYEFFEGGEPGAELYSAAGKRDQAKKVWLIACSMIRRDPYMTGRCRIYGQRGASGSILLDDDESYFQPLASEGRTEFGGNEQFVVLDEVWVQANRDLYDALTTGSAARRNRLILFLTTADEPGKETLCNDLHEEAKSVRDNPGDPLKPGYDGAFLPVVYEAPLESDWTSEAVWRAVHPLYDVMPTVPAAYREGVTRARANKAAEEAFRRYNLNQQVSTVTRWLDMKHWDACGDEPVDLDDLVGRQCFLGIDLSSTTDLTSVVALFPEVWVALPWFWVPQATAKIRDRKNDPMYVRWGKSGKLNLTEGDVIDYDLILGQVDEISKLYEVVKIGMDPAMAMQTALKLQERGHAVELVRQGWVTMTEPCKRLEVMLAKRQLLHGGHPVLRWNASNAKVKIGEKGEMSVVKPKDAMKVDGIVALLMALRLAMLEKPVSKSTPRAIFV